VKQRFCDFSRLLEETPEKYYWLGFLLADGHFESRGRLKVGLAVLDIEHLNKLRSFLNITSPLSWDRGQPRLVSMDSKILLPFMEKYKIKSNKTYEPPDLSSITNKDFLNATAIGFIDGDGCISYRHDRLVCNIRIKCHSSWLNLLSLLFHNAGSVKFDGRGYATANIIKLDSVNYWKSEAIRLKLPILARKWEKIDLNYKSNYGLLVKQREEVYNLLNQHSKTEVAKFLGVSDGAISNFLKRDKRKENQ
jgi:hypothetical protein